MSEILITTKTDSKELQDLIAKLNSGNMTVKEFNQAVRDLKNSSVIGSQGLKDLSDVIYQARQQMQSAAAQQNSLIGIMKQDRQERRLGMFAVMESMHALEGLTGKQNEFSKAITNGAQTVFGMKFALEAMGMASKAAWPVAIIVAAWSVISGILEGEKKAVEELNAARMTEIDLLIKLGRATNQQKLDLLSLQIAEQQTILSALQTQSIWQTIISIITHGKFGNVSVAEITAQKSKVDALMLSYKEIVEGINKKEAQDLKEQVAEHDKLIDLKWRDHEITLQEYGAELNLRLLRAQKLKDLTAEHELRKQLKDLYTITIADVFVTPNRRQLAERYRATNQGAPPAKEKAPEEKTITTAAKEMAVEFKNSNSAVELFKKTVSGTTDALAYSFTNLLNGTQNLGQTVKNFGNVLVQTMAQIAAEAAAKGIIGTALEAIGLAGGGNIQYAASGGTYRPGSSVIVGERGPEMLLVGHRSTQVIPNSQINQMGMQSRYSSNSMPEMVRGELIMRGNNVVLSFILSQQARSGRRF